jgi:5'-AMP-activated protein kinase catalytic alpha subunit
MFLYPSPDIDIKVIKQVGDYSLGTELGSGAFGKVVLGKHILTNELVAIKILDKIILNNTPDDYQSVKQEINILKSMKHKHIVQLYDVLQTSRHIFIIMEYCEGKDLLDYILTKSKLSEEESLKYFQQLINALFYLHSQNIAHRDIKIDNMLLDGNRDLKLVDFGLSTKYPDDNLLNQPCGTVVYAAPEILQGKEYHGMLADVWSSGIVLYGMLSGYLPFGEKDDDINRQNIINGIFKIPDYFSESVKDLLRHMLDLNPMTRYTLQEIRTHPWFNSMSYKLIPGIIIGYNIIPVDENILNLCVTYNFDKEKVRESVVNNKYDSGSALYYLLVKQLQKKGFHSVSDFCSYEFINFVLDDNNLIDSEKKLNKKKIQETAIKYNININADKNCSAPPDGKLKFNQKKNNSNNEMNYDYENNNNLLTPKKSNKENIDNNSNINKKINFDDTPNGIISFVINSPSCQEMNKDLFNLKSSNSINNKITNNSNNNDDDKNTSSKVRLNNLFLQTVNVEDFQIIEDGGSKEISDKKITNISELDNNQNLKSINNIFIDENLESENDYKILSVIYNNNDNTDNNNNEILSLGKDSEIPFLKNENDRSTHKMNNLNLNISINNNAINDDITNKEDNVKERLTEKIEGFYPRHNANILETPIVHNSTKPDVSEDGCSSKINNN